MSLSDRERAEGLLRCCVVFAHTSQLEHEQPASEGSTVTVLIAQLGSVHVSQHDLY